MYLFLGGHPKSGTTLLLALLDGHPELLVFPEELKIFQQVFRKTTKYGKIGQLLLETGAGIPLLDKVDFPSGTRDYSHVPSSKYFKDLKNKLRQSNNKKDLIDSVYLAYYNAINDKNASDISDLSCKYFVEKTPGNELYQKLTKSTFGKSKMIVTHRDPRDNYFTYKRKHPKMTIEDFCESWNSHINATFSLQDSFIVKYEALVENPKEILTAICEYLDISWDDILLTPTRGEGSWSGNSMFSENSPSKVHKHALKQRWRDLSDSEIKKIEALTFKNMERCGYKPEFAKSQAFNVLSIGKIQIKNFVRYLRQSILAFI